MGKLKADVCYNEALQQTLKTLPKHVRDKRDKESKKRAKERNRPIVVGNQRFLNVGALRGKVKEILNSRSDGEQLKKDGTDFKLITSLLTFHPKGAEKSKGLVGIKVAKSEYGDSRCFYMIRENGKDGGEEGGSKTRGEEGGGKSGGEEGGSKTRGEEGGGKRGGEEGGSKTRGEEGGGKVMT